MFFVDTIAVMPISTGVDHGDINMAAIIPINKAPKIPLPYKNVIFEILGKISIIFQI